MYGRGPPPSEVGVALHAGPAAGPPLQLAPAKVEEVDREKVAARPYTAARKAAPCRNICWSRKAGHKPK